MGSGEGMRTNGVLPAAGERDRSGARPDPEVSAKAMRRRFTAAYKLSIVERAERCEALYSSHLSSWRKAVREGFSVPAPC